MSNLRNNGVANLPLDELIKVVESRLKKTGSGKPMKQYQKQVPVIGGGNVDMESNVHDRADLLRDYTGSGYFSDMRDKFINRYDPTGEYRQFAKTAKKIIGKTVLPVATRAIRGYGMTAGGKKKKAPAKKKPPAKKKAPAKRKAPAKKASKKSDEEILKGLLAQLHGAGKVEGGNFFSDFADGFKKGFRGTLNVAKMIPGVNVAANVVDSVAKPIGLGKCTKRGKGMTAGGLTAGGMTAGKKPKRTRTQSDKQKRRTAKVKQIMREKGFSLPQASKYIKEHNIDY